MAVHLTETAISKAVREAGEAKERRELIDAKSPGLRLRITPPSRKTRDGSQGWVLCCRDREGRMRRFPLGDYPEMGISAARSAAKALHVRVIQEGADPIAERQRQRGIGRDAKAGIGTLAALIEMYEKHEGTKLKSWAECRRRIESVFRVKMDRPLETMKLSELQLVADTWVSGQSAAAAVRYLRPILKWAAHRRYVAADFITLSPPATVGRRDRFLSRDELAVLLPALSRSDRPYAAAMRFLLLTLARREELTAAQWGDVDLAGPSWCDLSKDEQRAWAENGKPSHIASWTIPAGNSKNGQPHVVPLSRQAVTLLRTRWPTDKDGKATKPKATALLFATATGGPLGNWDRETKLIMKASGTKEWTRHDLRRTGATMLGERGELPDIIEAALNHVAIRSQLAATYNRSRYRPQVANALQRLADALDDIEAAGVKAAIDAPSKVGAATRVGCPSGKLRDRSGQSTSEAA
jgi:integrase